MWLYLHVAQMVTPETADVAAVQQQRELVWDD